MRILDPGPEAVIREGGRDDRRSMTITFETTKMTLISRLKEMLISNEKFHTLLPSGGFRHWKIPTLVTDVLVHPSPIYGAEPKARVVLRSIGAPEPDLRIGVRRTSRSPHATYVTVADANRYLAQASVAEANIKGVLSTVERLMRAGASVVIDKDLKMDGHGFDSVYGLRGTPETTITVKGKIEDTVPLDIPKLWGLPAKFGAGSVDYIKNHIYSEDARSRVADRHYNKHLMYATFYGAPITHKDYEMGFNFTESAMKQARGRLVRSMREKLDAMMTGTLETTHKEKKVMYDSKTLKANRFYVGSDKALRTGWGKPTLAAAVEHAKQLLEDTGEDQFVVQIVRVVKKKVQPVVVEAVK